MIIGSDFTRNLADGTNLFVVNDVSGVTIDSVQSVVVTVTAVGEEFELQYLPRRMVVPPGGQFNNSGAKAFQGVLCATLKAALLISR